MPIFSDYISIAKNLRFIKWQSVIFPRNCVPAYCLFHKKTTVPWKTVVLCGNLSAFFDEQSLTGSGTDCDLSVRGTADHTAGEVRGLAGSVRVCVCRDRNTKSGSCILQRVRDCKGYGKGERSLFEKSSAKTFGRGGLWVCALTYSLSQLTKWSDPNYQK